MARRKTLNEFIEKAGEIHNNKYDYSKVVYKNSATKVTIICPIHGEFEQIPNSHIAGNGCSKCSNKKRTPTKDDFIKKAKIKYGDRYNYSKVVYKNSVTKVTIICPIHGEFQQTPHGHLHVGGCEKCGIEKRKNKRKHTKSQFIEKAKTVHEDKYIYDKVIYINNKTHVTITCPIHGDFQQRPDQHLYHKCGCPKCWYKQEQKTRKYLIEILGYEPKKKVIYNNENRKFVVDFFINTPNKTIIIEYNGPQHYEPYFFHTFMGKDIGEKKFRNQLKRDEDLRKHCKAENIVLLEIDGRKYTDKKIKQFLIENFIPLLGQ